MKRKLLFAIVALLCSIGSWAQQEPTNEGVYYLYNTETGKFLTRGNNWGTQAVTNDFGSPWKVYINDGKYTLRMLDIVTADGNTNRALGSNGFSDNPTAEEHVAWTVTGDVNGYKLSFDDKYLCSPETYGNNVINTDANYNTTWQFLNVDEYKAILAAKITAQESAIATTAGIDISASTLAAVVGNADNFEATDMSSSVPFPTNTSWTRKGVTNRGGDQNQGNYGVECYQGGITYGYTVTGLVKGVYKVGIKAMFRSTSNAVCHTIGNNGYVNSSAYLSANGYMVQIKDWYSSCTNNENPNSTDEFLTIANNGGYYSEVYAYVGDDGKLDLKAVSEAHWGANWFLFNGITLTYYRDKSADIVLPDNIELSQTSATLTTGSTLNLTATVTPADALNKTVLWSSSDESVATIDGGFIIAQKPGTATITVKAEADENVTATCTITVADASAPAFYSEIANGDFYIQNVATGMFLSGANDWGTHSSIIEHGTVYTAAKISDGVYTLDSHIYNNANDHFLAGDYTDGPATNLQIVALGDGKYSIANADGTAFFTAWPNSTYVNPQATNANSSFAQWYFVSKADRDKTLAAATAVNPVDATYYIPNAGFGRNQNTSYNENTWTVTANNSNLNSSANCAESYHSTFNVTKTISLPNGTYKFRAQGFYRQDGSDNDNLPEFFVGDKTITFPLRTGTEGSMAAAASSFAAGSYYTDYVTVTVTDRTLTLGCRLENNTDLWCIWDNFELYMTGYTANTGVTASIDNDEIEAGSTATITAATDPATASFNAITYTSSDEAIATVDENGVVTGVAVGTATITVTANEMEDFSTTVDVTVKYTSATTEDYAALNAAMEGKVIGFEEGEYAPYNNIAATNALAVAKAIDQTVSNPQTTVQEATAALTSATWTVNATEMNAVYDGSFAAATNDGAPAGWITTHSAGLGGSYHARTFVLTSGMTNYDNLEAFGQGDGTRSAFYIRFDGTNSDKGTWYNYGKTDGYKMPLKGSTTYYISLQAGAWGDYANKNLSVTIKDADGTNVVATTLKTTKKTSNGQGVDELTYVFTTNEAGDYTLSFWNNNGANYAAIVSNIELKKATEATMVITDAEWATFVAPFDVTIPSGVTAYTIEGANGTILNLNEVSTTIPANTPVVLNKKETLDATSFYGRPVDGEPTYGWLTGVYAETAIPEGSYGLQNQTDGEGVGFYQVDGNVTKKLGANRAYLTVPSSNGVKAFYFGDTETAIKSVFDGVAAGDIYDLNGRKVTRMQKGGIYVVNGRKVMVK